MTTIPTGEIKIKVMQNIWGGEVGGGQTRSIMGDVQMENSFNMRDTYCRE